MITKQIFIEAPTGKLDTLILYPENEQTVIGAVIVFHPDPLGGGNYNNKVVQIIAKTYSAKGYVVLCPNLHGVGASEGVFNKDDEASIFADALSIYKYAKIYLQHADRVDNIILVGFSFGTSVASRLAQAVEYRRLILVAPAVTRYEVKVTDVDKTTVIHSTGDEVIPIEAVYDWSKNNEIPIIVFVGISHFFHGRLLCLRDCLDHYCL